MASANQQLHHHNNDIGAKGRKNDVLGSIGHEEKCNQQVNKHWILVMLYTEITHQCNI